MLCSIDHLEAAVIEHSFRGMGECPLLPRDQNEATQITTFNPKYPTITQHVSVSAPGLGATVFGEDFKLWLPELTRTHGHIAVQKMFHALLHFVMNFPPTTHRPEFVGGPTTIECP